MINDQFIENSSLFQSDSSEEDANELETDAVAIQLEPDQFIHINYSQLCKHSQLIRDNYLISDVRFKLPKDIQKFQQKNKIKTENVISFFKLLQDEKNTPMSSDKYFDFLKLSDFFQIKKLTKNLMKYYKRNSTNIDFIIQSILSIIEKNDDSDEYQSNFSANMEDLLINHIDEFLKNENTIKLPVSLIYRILDKSDKDKISKDDLFELIMKSIDNFCVLFSFFDLKSITDEQLAKLLEIYNNSKCDPNKYFKFLQFDLNYINELRRNSIKNIEFDENEKNKLLIEIDQLKKENEQLQSKLLEFKQKNKLAKSNFIQMKNKNDLTNSNLVQMKQSNEKLQSDLLNLKNIISQLNNRLVADELSNNQLQSEIENYQKSNSQLKLNSDKLQSTIFQLKNQNESLQSNYIIETQKTTALENEKNVLNAKIQEMQNQISQYLNQINIYKIQNNQYQNQIKQYQNQNNQYQNQIKQYQNQINQYRYSQDNVK